MFETKSRQKDKTNNKPTTNQSSLVKDQENEQRSKNYLIKDDGAILIPFKQRKMTKGIGRTNRTKSGL